MYSTCFSVSRRINLKSGAKICFPYVLGRKCACKLRHARGSLPELFLKSISLRLILVDFNNNTADYHNS